MANRKLYRLENDGVDGVIVYRTDNNYGRQGVVFKDDIRLESYPYAMPDYIIREARRIMAADQFELARGYTYGGLSCQMGVIK